MGVDPYGTGGTHFPQYFRSDVIYDVDSSEHKKLCPGLFYPVTLTTVVCCILMQILCVVSQKSFNFWGTSVPPTSSLLLCPPNNPMRSTPLECVIVVADSDSISV